jgi:1-deoxy-D-xylulose-5-phosphate synthase
VARALEDAEVDVPLRTVGLPKQFLTHGKPADVRAGAGLNPAAIAERALIGLKKTSAPEPVAEPAMVERSA